MVSVRQENQGYHREIYSLLLVYELCVRLLTLKLSDGHFYFRDWLRLLFWTIISGQIPNGTDNANERFVAERLT